MQNVAIGWEIYERTGSALHLGYAGLAGFLPSALWTLVAGHVADTFNRKYVMLASAAVALVGSLGLLLNSALGGSVYVIYVCLFAIGSARAFMIAARAAFLPGIVPLELFSNSIAWSSSNVRLASIAGPAAGGILIAWSGSSTPVYVINLVGPMLFIALIASIAYEPGRHERPPMTMRSLFAGLGFIWNAKILLAGLMLDMFGVLLGGATALLPVYAKDVLQVGPGGLGWLTMAPSVGAFAMAFVQAHRRPPREAGRSMLFAVAAFGAVTIVFGLSRNFWLSMSMLFLLGACGSVSFVVRQTLVRTLTPDTLLGRVSAVNGLFMGTSSELGAFESGLVASWFGPVVAVVSGGVGTLMVVGVIARLFPQLRGTKNAEMTLPD